MGPPEFFLMLSLCQILRIAPATFFSLRRPPG